MIIQRKGMIICTLILGTMFLALAISPVPVQSHCDTMAGPVVQDAQNALESGDITPVLKWVNAKDEQEIRNAFKTARDVRGKGPVARELADRYFFETLVRVHRAGEGAPYTGLKPADAVEPIIVLSDRALESGDPEELIARVTEKVADGIREHFHHAAEARAHADESVEAGREYVEAYVIFTHYVEKLHTEAAGQSGAHGEEHSH